MKFLIDANISHEVVPAFRRAGGKSEAVALRDWHGGIYVDQHNGPDLPWLRLAGQEGWVVVHNDRKTLLRDFQILQAEGGSLPGNIIVATARQPDVRWIAVKLVAVEEKCRGEPPENIQCFLG